MNGFSPEDLMKQAFQMKEKMEKMQEELKELKVEVTVGGGTVTAVANGQKRLVSLKIDREVIDPDDADMLQDLVVAAVNEAMRRAEEKSQEEMSKIVPAGMLGGLSGLF